MEVLTHSGMYDITFNNYKEICDLKENLLKGEIFLSDNIPSYNHPTGKKLTLKVDKDLTSRISVEIFPSEFCGWEKIKEINLIISDEIYKFLLKGDSFQSQSPETILQDILINANHYTN